MKLLKDGDPFFVYAGDLKSLQEIVTSDFPTCFPASYQLQHQHIYHLMHGDTLSEECKEKEHFTACYVQSPDLKDRVVLIGDTLQWVTHFSEVIQYADAFIIAKSSLFTEEDAEVLRCIQNADFPVIYLNDSKVPDAADNLSANQSCITEAIQTDVVCFETHTDADAYIPPQMQTYLTQRCAETAEEHIHATKLQSLNAAKQLLIRVDEKIEATQHAQQHDGPSYAEKEAAAKQLNKQIDNRKLKVRSGIKEVYDDVKMEVGMAFQPGNQDSLYKEAMAMVNPLKKPKSFNDGLENRVNERLHNGFIAQLLDAEGKLDRRSAQIYNQEAEGVPADLQRAGFKSISIIMPWEYTPFISNTDLKDRLHNLVVNPELHNVKPTFCESLYRHGLPMSFAGGLGVGIGKLIKDKGKDEGTKCLTNLMFGGPENLVFEGIKTFISTSGTQAPQAGPGIALAAFEGIKNFGVASITQGGPVIAPGVALAAFEGIKTLGVASITVSSPAAPMVGIGAVGSSAFAGQVASAVTVLTGPVGVCVLGGVTLGFCIGRKLSNVAKVKAYKNAYEKSIKEVMTALNQSATNWLSKLNTHVTDTANAAMTTLSKAAKDAINAELSVCKAAEQTPYEYEAMLVDKDTLNKIITKLSNLDSGN